MEQITVLTATDLHLKPTLYDQLALAVAKHRPAVTCLIGDFLDHKAEGWDLHRYNHLSPKAAAKRLAALPGELGFTLGNHESYGWDEFYDAWTETGRPLNVLHGSALAVGPLKIVGFPCATGGMTEFRGVWQPSSKHYNAWLPQLLWAENAAAQTLWLMHEPPVAELGDAVWAVNDVWREAIDLYQPILTVSGHDHRLPVESDVWSVGRGRVTTCVNVGQTVSPIPGPLRYCLITFEFPSRTPSLPARTSVERLIWPMPDCVPF